MFHEQKRSADIWSLKNVDSKALVEKVSTQPDIYSLCLTTEMDLSMFCRTWNISTKFVIFKTFAYNATMSLDPIPSCSCFSERPFYNPKCHWLTAGNESCITTVQTPTWRHTCCGMSEQNASQSKILPSRGWSSKSRWFIHQKVSDTLVNINIFNGCRNRSSCFNKIVWFIAMPKTHGFTSIIY